MLDTAGGLVVYPSLEHRIKKKASGTFARLFSGWRS